MTKPVQVIWNETSRGGKNLKLSQSILKERHPTAEFRFLKNAQDWSALEAEIGSKVKSGYHRWIAAGGDGTVHSVLNLLAKEPATTWSLGLIGVGSSNDYHQPNSESEKLPNGIFVRDHFDRCHEKELMLVKWTDQNGKTTQKVSFLNSSLGITAVGNQIFSSHDPKVEKWKQRSVDLAILISAFTAWKNFEPVRVELIVDGKNSGWHSLSNFSVFKNRFFSGSFRYPENPSLGSLGVAYVDHEGKWKNLAKMIRLAFGKFPASETSRLFEGTEISVNVENGKFIPLEIDGEVYLASKIQWSVVAEKVNICS